MDLQEFNQPIRAQDLNQQGGASSDPLVLSNSNHPGAQLIALQLNGTNFLNWSFNVKLALGAKSKLGCIDGSCSRPTPGTFDCSRWIKADYMIRCWLLNSMEPNISRTFMRVESAKQLWDELLERFGQENGPLLYQLKRTLTSLQQGTQTVGEYYCKLKGIWDEISCLEYFPFCECGYLANCTCEIIKKLQEQDSKNRVLQFLMGLGEEFEGIRSNILSMDPMPTMNKVFYLVQQVERQKIVIGTLSSIPNGEAFSVNNYTRNQFQQSQKYFYPKDSQPRDGNGKSSKNDKKCDFCHMKGHLKDQCYRLNGYPPNWKFKQSNRRANVADTEQDNPFENLDKQRGGMDPAMISSLCQEMSKFFQAKDGVSISSSSGNFADMSLFNTEEEIELSD